MNAETLKDPSIDVTEIIQILYKYGFSFSIRTTNFDKLIITAEKDLEKNDNKENK